MSKRVVSIVTAFALAAVLPMVASPAHAGSTASPLVGASTVTAGIATLDEPAPEPLTQPVITGTTQVGETLTAQAAEWPVDGTSTFTWWSYDEAVRGSGPTYVVLGDDLDHAVTLIETFSSPGFEDATATVVSATIVRAAPQATVDPSITGTTQVGQTLTAQAAEWPVDGESTFVWSVDDTPVGSGTTYVAVPANLGKTVTVTETFTSPGYAAATATAESATITRGSAPVATAAPTITGTAQVGQTLTAQAATWPIAGASSLVWSVAGTQVGTGKAYVVRPSDLDKTVTLTETFISPGYDVATSAVESAKAVLGAAPTATVRPWVAGAIRVGSTLAVTPATWPQAGAATFSWSVGGKTVGTGTSYVVTAADVGKPFVFTETLTPPGYQNGTASTQPETVAKAPVTLSVARGKAKKGKKVPVTVTSKSGPLTVSGKVTLTYAGKKVGSPTLKNGKVTVKVPAKQKGQYWLTISYAGTSVFAKAGKTVAVKVK